MTPVDLPLVKESISLCAKPLSTTLVNLSGRFHELNGFDHLISMMNVSPEFKAPIFILTPILKSMTHMYEINLTPSFVDKVY
jgi:hypothetical protein